VSAHANPPRVAIAGGLVFVASDAITFAALLGSALILRLGGHDWPAGHASLTQLAILTVLLFGGSALIAAANRGARPRVLLGAAVLGLAFVGAELLEWRALLHGSLGPRADLRHASLFVVTGLHGLHVLAGAIALALLGLRGRLGGAARVLSYYWLALDLAWLGIVGTLYL
jgi:heme/copper-type cytochrome/quinol oxidase subunit 3